MTTIETAKLPVTFDATGLTEAGIGPAGLSERELAGYADACRRTVDSLRARRASGEIGFLDLADDVASARAIMDYVAGLPPTIDTVVVLGIGGSSLGPRALYSALGPAFDLCRPRSPGMPRRLFFPDNIDPVTIKGLLEVIIPERTLFNVVTKSGGTAETAAQLLVVYDHLERTLGANAAKHLVVTTDPERGALRGLATELGWTTFPVPPSVGGRFSVLSAVGLLPAALAGLDVVGLLDGARQMRDAVFTAAGDARTTIRDNPALAFAVMLHAHHQARQRPMVIMKSYVDGLYDTADWFRQLWAESLGKEKSLDGATINVGPTPIAARGATDQHSQLQLYTEGPDDKAYVFVTVADRGTELTMPANRVGEHADYHYLVGRGMGELLDAECRGTFAALTRRGRPAAKLVLDRADARSLGATIMLLEAATAYAGPLYNVDPFDQPGVEEAKRLAFCALGRPGYDKYQGDLDAAPAPVAAFVFNT